MYARRLDHNYRPPVADFSYIARSVYLSCCLTWYAINIPERVKKSKRNFLEINFTHPSQLCEASLLYRIIDGISPILQDESWSIISHLAIDSRPSQMNPGMFRFKLSTSSSTQIRRAHNTIWTSIWSIDALSVNNPVFQILLWQHLTNPGINSINNEPTI